MFFIILLIFFRIFKNCYTFFPVLHLLQLPVKQNNSTAARFSNTCRTNEKFLATYTSILPYLITAAVKFTQVTVAFQTIQVSHSQNKVLT